MQQRSVVAVIIFTIITFGIYSIFWYANTRGELNANGASVPTTWLIIIPLVNIYYLWKYSEGVEQVTKGKFSGVLAFVLLWLTGVIGMAVVQHTYNQLPKKVAVPVSS